MRLLAGIDSGGTKTAIRIITESGELHASLELPALTTRVDGADAVATRLAQKIADASHGHEVSGVAAGMPFVGESVDGDREIFRAMAQAFGEIPLYICNDAQVGWAGSLALKPGVNVVSGTGSIAYGVDQNGVAARCGGWDELYSDEGSCYWVGRELMGLFTKQADGRLPRGALYDIIMSEFNLTSELEFVDAAQQKYTVSRRAIASFQLFAERAALAGDATVTELYRRAAHELAQLVGGIKNQLNFAPGGFAVSYSGGIFRAGDLILKPFADAVRALNGSLHTPELSPVAGAVLLSLREFSPHSLRQAAEQVRRWDTR